MPTPDPLHIQLELMTELSRSGSLEETLTSCYRAALAVSGLDCGGIYLTQPDGSLELAFHDGLGDAFVAANDRVGADDPRAVLVRAGQAHYTSLPTLRASLDPATDDDPEGVRALAVVPIRFDGEAVGCMNLASHRFDEVPPAARTVLEILAAQIAQSIARAVTNDRLRDREENLHTFFEGVDDLLFVLDADGVILEVNPSAARRLSGSTARLKGLPFVELHDNAHRHALAGLLASLPIDGTASFEAPMAGTGAPFPAGTRITRRRWNGHPAYFCVTRDRTAEREAEAERAALRQKMQEAQRLESLGLLAGGVAHDVNNLLVSVLGNASMALAASQDTPTQAYLADIILASRQAATLGRQMLAYSGRGVPSTTVLELGDTVRELASLVQTAHGHRVPIHLELAPDARVCGDPGQLGQVVMNLVLNAVESMEGRHGGVTVRLERLGPDATELASWSLERALPYVRLSVHDQGHGMSTHTVERLFDPFFTTKPEGRGLGLAAVRGIVQAHGGAIRVASTPDVGTCFEVLLPEAPQSSQADTRVVPSDLGGRRVLLVDDDPSILRVLARILERAGATLVTAASGEEAIAFVARTRSPVDLIFLDLTMPGLGGLSTFTALGALSPEVPVVLMSGYAEHEVDMHREGRSPSAFLSKPFGQADVLATAQRALADATALPTAAPA